MAYDEDLDVFLDESEHALAAVYDGASAVSVILDRAYLETLGVANAGPAALGKASDFPEATCRGKTLVIDGTTYTIKNREPLDDGAFVLLTLDA